MKIFSNRLEVLYASALLYLGKIKYIQIHPWQYSIFHFENLLSFPKFSIIFCEEKIKVENSMIKYK